MEFLKQRETWIWRRAPERQPHIFCEWFWIWLEAQALAALQVTAEPGAAWPFPVTHSGKEQKRKGEGDGRTEEKKTSGTGDSLSGALRDESLIGHRSISRSSGSCTHLMIGHDVSLNTRANEWLPTQTPPAHPCRRKIAQNFSQPAITWCKIRPPTTNRTHKQCLYAFLIVSFTEFVFCVAYVKAIKLKNSYVNVY